MNSPGLLERLKALLPKPTSRKAQAEESTIRMRQSRDQVQAAMARLTDVLSKDRR